MSKLSGRELHDRLNDNEEQQVEAEAVVEKLGAWLRSSLLPEVYKETVNELHSKAHAIWVEMSNEECALEARLDSLHEEPDHA